MPSLEVQLAVAVFNNKFDVAAELVQAGAPTDKVLHGLRYVLKHPLKYERLTKVINTTNIRSTA